MKKIPQTNFEKIADLLKQVEAIKKYINKLDYFNAEIHIRVALQYIAELGEVIKSGVLLDELKSVNKELNQIRKDLKIIKREFPVTPGV